MAYQAIAFHMDAEQHCVTVAIREGGNHAQTVAGSLTLHPKLLPGARVKSYVAGFNGARVSLKVHKSHHQHLAGGVLLYDSGRQPVHFVEINLHVSSQMAQNKKPADFCCRRALNLYKCAVLTLTGLRRHVRRVMMVMMAMCEGEHGAVMLANLPRACQLEKGQLGGIFREIYSV